MAFRGRPGNREPYREGPGRGIGRGWSDEGLRITVPNSSRGQAFQNRERPERFYDEQPPERFDSRYDPPPLRRPATERLGPQHSERPGDSYGRNPVRDEPFDQQRGPPGRPGPLGENPHRPPMDPYRNPDRDLHRNPDRAPYRNPDRESDVVMRDPRVRENMNPERPPMDMHDRHPPPRGDPRGDPFLREDSHRNPERFDHGAPPRDFPGREQVGSFGNQGAPPREQVGSFGRELHRRESDPYRQERVNERDFRDGDGGDSLVRQPSGPRSILKNKSLESLREPPPQGADVQEFGHEQQRQVSGFSFDAGSVNLPGLESVQPIAAEIEDEDAFLYGEQPNESQRGQPDPTQEGRRDQIKMTMQENRKQQPPQLDRNNRHMDDSWSDMDQRYEYDQQEEARLEEEPPEERNQQQDAEDEPESMLQNILQSIGFDFELSKRMQEIARKKKEPDPESFGINKTTSSFLGGGLKRLKNIDIESALSDDQDEARIDDKRREEQRGDRHEHQQQNRQQQLQQQPQQQQRQQPQQQQRQQPQRGQLQQRSQPQQRTSKFSDISQDFDRNSFDPTSPLPPAFIPAQEEQFQHDDYHNYEARYYQEVQKQNPEVNVHLRSLPMTQNRSERVLEVPQAEKAKNRTVIPPKQKPQGKEPRIYLTQQQRAQLMKEREERQSRMKALERELDQLKNQQNELMRKKRRQRDVHKDPLIVENSKLQEEIAHQISVLRKAADDSQEKLKAVEDVTIKKKENEPNQVKVQKKKEQVEEEVRSIKIAEKPKPRNEYFDPGNHWCSACNYISLNIFDVFQHLQTKKHLQKVDPYDRPWMPDKLKNPKKEIKKPGAVQAAALKGVEFLMSTQALYCRLCNVFSGDATCGEDHLKSEEHNEMYRKHTEDNPYYESRHNLERAAGIGILQPVKTEIQAEIEKIEKRKIEGPKEDDLKRRKTDERDYRPIKRGDERDNRETRYDRERDSRDRRDRDVRDDRDFGRRSDRGDDRRDRDNKSYSSRRDDSRDAARASRFKKDLYGEKYDSSDDEADIFKNAKKQPNSGFGRFQWGQKQDAQKNKITEAEEKKKAFEEQRTKFSMKLPMVGKLRSTTLNKPAQSAPVKPTTPAPTTPVATTPKSRLDELVAMHANRADLDRGPVPLDMFLSDDKDPKKAKKGTMKPKEVKVVDIKVAFDERKEEPAKIPLPSTPLLKTPSTKQKPIDPHIAAEMKQLGIEVPQNAGPVPKRPPTLVCGPSNPTSKMAASSASDMYGVFYGSEKAETYKKPEKDDGNDSDASGESMQMGSDFEVLDEAL